MNFNIQHISYSKNNQFSGEGLTLGSIFEPRSLDEFDVNVVDLSSEYLWRNDESDRCLGCNQELENIRTMKNESNKCKMVIILPQNIQFKYLKRGGEYIYSVQIKELLGDDFEKWIESLTFLSEGTIIHENTITKLNGIDYKAAFHFINGFSDVYSKSDKSEKITTIFIGDVYLTTLEIMDYKCLINYLDYIKVIELKESCPQWIRNYKFFNDITQEKLIQDNKKIIEDCNDIIDISNKQLETNNRYKSILYTNGTELVSVVFDMLEKMLQCDLSKFEDEKKEDFLIQLGSITFIGEIKGVTSNIKNEHISQLDVHYQGYLDRTLQESKKENVKSLLIINHQRLNENTKRQPVHENQIKLAERNESLIIETSTFLRLFELFLCKNKNSEDIIKLFSSEIGLLKLENNNIV